MIQKKFQINTKLILFIVLVAVFVVYIGFGVFKFVQIGTTMKRCGRLTIAGNELVTSTGIFPCQHVKGKLVCTIATQNNISSLFVYNPSGKYGYIAVDMTSLGAEAQSECQKEIKGNIVNDIPGRFLCVNPNDYIPCQ